MSDKLEPLVDGVRRNKNHWLDLAQQGNTRLKNLQNSVPAIEGNKDLARLVEIEEKNEDENADDVDVRTVILNEGDAVTINNNNITRNNNKNGINDENLIPRIVGKLSKLDSQINFPLQSLKMNGTIVESDTAVTACDGKCHATENNLSTKTALSTSVEINE